MNVFKESSRRAPRKELFLLAKVIGEGERVSPNSQMNIIISDNSRLRRLNRKYRGKDKPTDVLSFDFRKVAGSSELGEIYISVDKAQSQALERGHSFKHEILSLACHGILHVLGYEHDNDKLERKMKERERHYLSEIRNQSS
ncbi:MAG: rRNA maturation RNase YbeY [candidate division Zixibacteria bacterium]|nr:rRNA maturation RNase YbeY [candidate division Zixibacteria bacterium]